MKTRKLYSKIGEIFTIALASATDEDGLPTEATIDRGLAAFEVGAEMFFKPSREVARFYRRFAQVLERRAQALEE